MTTCPKCGYTRRPRDTAPGYVCPKCGVVYAKAAPEKTQAPARAKKSKHVNPWLAGFILLGLAGFIYATIVFESGRPARRTETLPAVYNSAWDGSVRQVEQYLRATLKDPGSFQAMEWYAVVQQPDGFAVRVRYRAKNSFGAFVVEDRVFFLGPAGNVVR